MIGHANQRAKGIYIAQVVRCGRGVVSVGWTATSRAALGH